LLQIICPEWKKNGIPFYTNSFLLFYIKMIAALCLVSSVASFVSAGDPPAQGMVVNSLDISAPQNNAAEISIKSGTSKYNMGVRSDGTFAITDGDQHPYLTVEEGNIFAHTQVLSAGGLSSDQNMAVGGITQWALIVSEDYAAGTDGWGVTSNTGSEGCGDRSICSGSPPIAGENTKCLEGKVTPCGGVRMLGGYRAFGPGNIHKTFSTLRQHKQIRVTGSYHFIDNWEGETGFVMLGEHLNGRECDEMTYGFTHSYDAREVSSAINVCGDATPEGRLSVPFDIILPHTSQDIEIILGSTLKSGDRQFDKGEGSAWWGVSGLEIHIR
jgi:hypothetical protein